MATVNVNCDKLHQYCQRYSGVGLESEKCIRKTLKTTNCVLYANEFHKGKEGPLMPAANHSTGMEKDQIAISSSERDKGTLLRVRQHTTQLRKQVNRFFCKKKGK